MMLNSLAKPTKESIKKLSGIRQVLVTSFYYLAVNDEGVGFADSEYIKKNYQKMITSKLSEGEWFALECQANQIFAKCNEMYNSGVPINGKKVH